MAKCLQTFSLWALWALREGFKTSQKVLKVAQWKDANGSWKSDDWLMTDWWTDGGEGSGKVKWLI